MAGFLYNKGSSITTLLGVSNNSKIIESSWIKQTFLHLSKIYKQRFIDTKMKEVKNEIRFFFPHTNTNKVLFFLIKKNSRCKDELIWSRNSSFDLNTDFEKIKEELKLKRKKKGYTTIPFPFQQNGNWIQAALG